ISIYVLSSFFFFQAEDGIRDFHVTGVQTCALPISRRLGARAIADGARLDLRLAQWLAARPWGHRGERGRVRRAISGGAAVARVKIGRASCRERGWMSVAAAR